VRQIYLDYNATTPIAPSVVEAMLPFLHGHHGNPSSSHSFGRAAKEAIEDARAKIAGLIGCDRSETIITGGATEADNLALKGIMLAGNAKARGHLIISAIEHSAISQPAKFLRQMGCEVTVVDCDENGIVWPEAVEEALRPNTRLVSIMHANNEIGTIQPIRQIAELCHRQDVLVHTDAAQSVGKIPAMVDELDVDLLTLAGHKFYAPKGIGVLFVRSGLSLEPLLHGAGQEDGIRSGTENTPYIVGLGQAAHLAAKCLDAAGEQMAKLRDQLQYTLLKSIDGLMINGEGAERLPNTLSVSFPGVTGQQLLARVPEICASLGAACHSDGSVASTTLAAMGCDEDHMAGTIRLSVGWQTSAEEIEQAADLLIGAWESSV